MALFTRQQALTTGYSPRQIQHRRETGDWEQMQAGVYRAGGAPASWEQRLLAACLAAGTGAVASHRSAARVWGLDTSRRPLVELSVPPGRHPRLDGVIVHRSGDLRPIACTIRDGIPVTTPLRTILDLGAVQGLRTVERSLDIALGRQLVTLRGLRTILDSSSRRGRQGVGVLRVLLDQRSESDELTESVLEARMLRLCRDHGLPRPVGQHEVRNGTRLVGRIDFAYPDDHVAIEVDGYESHAPSQRFATTGFARTSLSPWAGPFSVSRGTTSYATPDGLPGRFSAFCVRNPTLDVRSCTQNGQGLSKPSARRRSP